jgi:hypothetical protein
VCLAVSVKVSYREAHGTARHRATTLILSAGSRESDSRSISPAAVPWHSEPQPLAVVTCWQSSDGTDTQARLRRRIMQRSISGSTSNASKQSFYPSSVYRMCRCGFAISTTRTKVSTP